MRDVARGSPFVAVALIVPLLALAGGAAVVLGFSIEGGTVAIATLLVPIAAILGARALHRRGPSARIVAAFAALGFSLPIFLACSSTLGEPLVGGWSCGTGKLSDAMTYALLALGGSTVLGVLGALAPRLARTRAGEIALRALATLAITTLLALTAVAATHGARESPATWLASEPARVIEPRHDAFESMESWDGPPTELDGASFVLEHRVGEGVTTTDLRPPRGRARSCTLVVKRGGVEERVNVAYLYGEYEVCPAVRVRHLADLKPSPITGARDAFVVERRLSPTDPYSPSSALDGETLTPRTLRPADVRRLGPPHAWLWGVLFGGAIALVCFVASARAPRATKGIEGTHRGDGWVTLVDAAPRFFPSLTGVASGPVVLRSTALTASYRDDGGVAHDAEVIVGSHDEIASERRLARAAWSALALGIALLALAPLLASAAFGLL
jgi:hypothetical protein